MSIEVGLLIAMVGCFIGLAGWLAGRDKKVSADAEWRGSVNAKLDTIVGIKSDVETLEKEVKNHGERIRAVESSAQQAHHRMDRLDAKKGG